MSNMQSGLRLEELLREVQERLAEVVATRGRMQGLLDAVLAVASDLELEATPASTRRPRAAGSATSRNGRGSVPAS